MKRLPLILVIEDSVTQARQLAARLISASFRVVIANDGHEGLNSATVYMPDAIVLDVNLPVMDGYQVCRRLKRDTATASIPVIMFSTSDNADATIRGLEAGAQDYIPKDGFAVENLVQSLRVLGISAVEVEE